MSQSVPEGSPAPGVLSVVAGPDDAGERIDRFLAARLPDLSRARLQALMRQGAVSAGARTLEDPSARVNAGETYVVAAPPPAPAAPQAQAIALDVVLEDDHLIVIDKPAGLVVHPAAGHADGTLVNALLAHCGTSLSGVGGVARPGIVHRLDKDTSGLMVVAKHDLAHRALSAQFADHGRTGPLVRSYRAFVWGLPRHPRGVVDAPLGRSERNREKIAIRSDGRFAVTHWETLERFEASDASLVECRLETGRTHQIRVHMASLGHPLMGDAVYGASHRTKASKLDDGARAALESLDRQALHAAVLGFAHPATGETLLFESALPGDLAALAAALRARRDP
ncbi:23S rRNA pseudouridine1911/1915/1917 synthase [Methylopila capsulata]|uniref:Pseudouridine synthase n=1 Tax=Methylopila capsulata TaxID=61654 RepID=A0A9W6IQ39_9HYPH|nr:RluA family pseudouridine synthase [Methylopila capsulata]MBM7851333.1 23S rRNA pseudouridine1911/1915/1917 synthase [Methylopila capsulata]GLK54391.1 pseudouridine synthase [Methylopila capsulata]